LSKLGFSLFSYAVFARVKMLGRVGLNGMGGAKWAKMNFVTSRLKVTKFVIAHFTLPYPLFFSSFFAGE